MPRWGVLLLQTKSWQAVVGKVGGCRCESWSFSLLLRRRSVGQPVYSECSLVGRVRGGRQPVLLSFDARVSGGIRGGQAGMKPETVAARGDAEECVDEAVVVSIVAV